MQVCAQCGELNPDEGSRCTTCGGPLAPRKRSLQQTMVGATTAPTDAPGEAPTGGASTARANPAQLSKRTLLGLPGADLGAADDSAIPRHSGLMTESPRQVSGATPGFDPKRTLIGGVMPSAAGAATSAGGKAAASPPPGAEPATATPGGAAPRKTPVASMMHPGADPSQLGKTLLGMPPAGTDDGLRGSETFAPGEPNTQPSPTREQWNPGGGSDLPLPRGVAPQVKRGLGATLLGVAVPGIAPLNPGMRKPEAQQRTSAPPVESSAPTGAASSTTRAPDSDAHWPHLGRQKRSARLLLGVAATLLLGIVLFLVLWDPAPPLQAHVDVAADGMETLTLRCGDCPPGSEVRLEDAVAPFENGQAALPLEQPLPVGNNQLTVTLLRPGLGRDEVIPLTVPVHHRLQADLSGLTQTPPSVGVAIEAVPGSAVELAGESVRLTHGRALVPLDVSGELQGQASDVQQLHRELNYRVTTPAGAVREGRLNLVVPIVPLVIDTPRSTLITEAERFMLSGRTDKRGSVSVTGKAISLDAEGRFAQLMSIDSVGETTISVRADLESHASRFVRLRIRRVESLKEEAEAFRRDALRGYTEAMRAAHSPSPARVALRGKVEEARAGGHASIVLLDVEEDCPASPCLARVVLPQRIDPEKGQPLSVYGTTAGTVDGPVDGSAVLAVDAAFVVE